MKIVSDVTFKWNSRIFDFEVGENMATVFEAKNVDVQGYSPTILGRINFIVYDDKDLIIGSSHNVYATFNNVEIIASICK